MKLKSEMMSNILKIMLWALVTLTTLTLIANFIYVIDSSFYMDSIYSINSFIDSVSAILYIIIMLIYLIWIYRVHMDLKVSFPTYPRSPGAALACSMIPLFSFYGLPSTYRMIGQHFQHETTGVEKQGRWISGLAIPLVICFGLINVLNRLVAKADGDPSTALLLTSNAAELTTHIVFLSLCILISKGLQQINLNNETPIPVSENQPEWAAYVR
jgi:hypothetical protein